MRFVLKTLCVLTIPVMLVAFVVDARTELTIAAVIFTVSLLVIEFGLLDVAADYAWSKDDEDDSAERQR